MPSSASEKTCFGIHSCSPTILLACLERKRRNMVFTTTPILTWKICCDDSPSSKLDREHSQLHVRGERKMRQTFSMAHLSAERFCLPLPISIRAEVLLRSAERSEQR